MDANSPWVLYANCNVVYDGRASSYLDTGNYLIVHKQDGSLLIHASEHTVPRNYQGPKSKLVIENGPPIKLISTNKKEIITIVINNIIEYHELYGWSNNKIDIVKTEKELVAKLLANLDKYVVNAKRIFTEYSTIYGPVDVLVIDADDVKHVFEVKRKTATMAANSQLHRYLQTFVDARGYIVSPAISDNALKYCMKCGYTWIKLDF